MEEIVFLGTGMISRPLLLGPCGWLLQQLDVCRWVAIPAYNELIKFINEDPYYGE